MSTELNPICRSVRHSFALHIDANPHRNQREYHISRMIVPLEASQAYYAYDQASLGTVRRDSTCQRLLLEADADPTVAPQGNNSYTPIVQALYPRFLSWDGHRWSVLVDHDGTVSFKSLLLYIADIC